MGVIVAGGHQADGFDLHTPLTASELAPQAATTFTEASTVLPLLIATAEVPSGTAKVAEPAARVEMVAPPEDRRGDDAFWVAQLAVALQDALSSMTTQPFAVTMPVAGFEGVGVGVVEPPSPPPPQATNADARKRETTGEPSRLSQRSNRCGLWAVGCGLWAVGCGLVLGHGHVVPPRV